METLLLNRLRTSDEGTFGELLRDTYSGPLRIAVTCELPWNENLPGLSCIPFGSYLCRPHFGDKFKNVWELAQVPGRSDILIHNGNTVQDTDGCILVGAHFGALAGVPAVLESVCALQRLRNQLPKFFTLKIDAVPSNQAPSA